MKIAKDTVVTLEVELADVWGNLLERSEQPVHYLHGGYDGIFDAVESALEGKQVGDKLSLRLEPEDAFGDYDDTLVRLEKRDKLPQGVEVGMQFEGMPGDDDDIDADAGIIYTVTDIAADSVVLDGNHPYAGIALQFSCTVRDVRAATADEVEQGHADDDDDSPVRVVE